MRHSDDIKDIFLDMQRHPENYSDAQIEEMMAELDKPVDVEAAWQDFSDRHLAESPANTTHRKTVKRISTLWLRAIAAMAVIAVGVWGVVTFTATQEVSLTAENTDITNIGNGADRSWQDTISPLPPKQSGTLIAQSTPLEKDAANMAHSKDAGRQIITDTAIRVRGTTTHHTARNGEPLVIVNGHRIARLELNGINAEDIDSIRVYKDEEKRAEYEARFGTEAKYGIIDITLKADRAHAYADILNRVPSSEKVFAQVEKMPEFPGGEGALIAFIKENVKYPAECPDSSITGRVAISFVVASDGSTRDFKVVRCWLKNADKTACTDSTTIGIFTDEAIRVCRMMPRWTPGGMYTNDGYKKLNIRYTVPVRFGREDNGTLTGIRIRGDRNGSEHSQHRDHPLQ